MSSLEPQLTIYLHNHKGGTYKQGLIHSLHDDLFTTQGMCITHNHAQAKHVLLTPSK